MRFLPIYYKISMTGYFGDETQTVWGFAADTAYRICAHMDGFGNWTCTDYDTGRRIGEAVGTRAACIKNAVARIEQYGAESYALGKAKALARLKDAGLLK